MNNDLVNKKCQACSGFSERLNINDAKDFLRHLPAWNLGEDGLKISRNFNFKNFKQTMFFINAVAFIAESEMHHPDIVFGYNYCNITLTTHELNGLSENDFIVAHKINLLLDK